MEAQRHLAFLALDQFELALVAVAEPVDEFHGVAHGGREQERADLRRQQPQREFPDHAALGIGEAVELVHHHGADLAEVEGLAVQQAVEQDFGHDHQHAGLGVLAAIAGHQADVVGMETPAGRGRSAFRGTSARSGRSAAWCSRPWCRCAGPRTAPPRRSASCPSPWACRPARPARPRTRPAGPLPGSGRGDREADRNTARPVRRAKGLRSHGKGPGIRETDSRHPIISPGSARVARVASAGRSRRNATSARRSKNHPTQRWTNPPRRRSGPARGCSRGWRGANSPAERALVAGVLAHLVVRLQIGQLSGNLSAMRRQPRLLFIAQLAGNSFGLSFFHLLDSRICGAIAVPEFHTPLPAGP